MNQTNFGFNPNRNTLASNPQPTTQGVSDFIESTQVPVGHRSLNTQKRARNHTIDAQNTAIATTSGGHRGHSLNVQELHATYNSAHGKPMVSTRGPQNSGNSGAAMYQTVQADH